ncbi:MAG TPA: hypothetical protein VFN68_07105 [Acidimicrobiales bacterium]|nr:hypothetical protein [Acidimicrobiales bacterium]
MYSSPYEPGPGYPHGTSEPPRPCRPSLLRMIVAAVLIGVVASLLFGPALWAVGILFHIIGFALRVAILIAVGTFIWRRVARGRVRRGRI